MSVIRIMPCLDMKNGRVVKGIHFVDIKDAGDPVENAAFYRKEGADELAMLEPVPGALQTGGAHRPAQLYRVRPAYRRQLSLSARGL